MSKLRIERVNALPGTLTASTMYIVAAATAGLADVYFSNADGSAARHIISKDEISAMVADSISSFNNILLVADITARNALTPVRNVLCLVSDATGDATVAVGAAMYFYEFSTTTWVKVTEFESLDVVLNWASIQDKPASTVAEIDDAVARKHSHTNAAQLAKVGEDVNGDFTYNGAGIQAEIAVAAW